MEADFRANRYKYAGDVEVTICDLNLVATTLAQSGVIQQAYGILGVSVDQAINPTPKEIAISSVLLFGSEAKELRERIIDANVCATLLDQAEAVSEEEIVSQVAASLPGVNIERGIESSISRLRTAGMLIGSAAAISLSEEKHQQLISARTDFSESLKNDVRNIQNVSGLHVIDASILIGKARELLVRGKDFHGDGAREEDIRSFLAEHGLVNNRKAIYEALSSCDTIRQFQFGETVDQIFSTDTFDIYRALGGRTNLTAVLDTSVALPLLLGIEFRATESRYGIAVSAFDTVCKQHGIKLLVPNVYVNEMAAHRRKALDYLEVYPALPDEAKRILRTSRNAYLSHFAHLSDSDISLEEFLSHFGINKGYSLRRMENRVMSMLESHGIETGFSTWYDSKVRSEIAALKEGEIDVIIDHDAAVCTNLINNTKNGYIFATWDRILQDVVQDLARIFADNPARINDTLSLIEGADYESDRSEELLFTLLHMDETAAKDLSDKIEAIRSVDQAHRFRAFVEDARKREGASWRLDEQQIAEFFSSDSIA